MNTLINRFFTRSETEQLADPLIPDKRHQALHHMLDKAAASAKSSRLRDRIDSKRFSDDVFLADLEFISLYLDIEDHLINTDPRFIGTPRSLRQEILDRFPGCADEQQFGILMSNKQLQETWFCKLFLKYALTLLKENDRCTDFAQAEYERFELQFSISGKLNIVDRINLSRKLREYGNRIYFEITPLIGNNETDLHFHQAFNTFKDMFKRLDTVSSIEEVIPLLEEEPEETPVRKLVPVRENDPSEPVSTNIGSQQQAILENMLDGFVLIDSFGHIKNFNNNALNIFGLSREEFQHRYIYDFLPAELRLDLKSDLQSTDTAVPKKVIGKRTEILITNSTGESQDYEIAITNNFSSGRATYSIFLKDISSKTHMLEAIREAKTNAERSAKAKSTFLSNMSHEIRTPLNVILGLSEMIKNGDFEDHDLLRKKIDGIDFSARNLLSIVNDILDFSKIEAGKLSIQSIDFNLRKVVESLASGFEIKANEKGISLLFTMDDKIPDLVIGDQYRLNQILTNLIGNAIKFTKSGKICIDVSIDSSDKEGVRLRFRVEDTGIGIPEEHLDRIFDSFYQVNNRENPEVNGTGLGLAITKELIHLQKGEFTATSEVDVGSVFEFVLPYKLSKLKSLKDNGKSFARDDSELKGLKVLVAEDNKMNQFYIKHLLGRLDVDVDIAENGREAVQKYQKGKSDYDLILMDMHMPVMNGIEAIEEIKNSEKNSVGKVPIVACSADVFPESRKSAIKAGIDFYLTKPVNEDAIKEVLFWLIADEEFKVNGTPQEMNREEVNKDDQQQRSIDISLLQENFDNDEEFIRGLLEVFIKTTPEDYNSMRNCIDREYYARASSLAHKMKSSFMNLGMTLHGHHLQQIESNIIKNNGVPEARKHLKAFSGMYTKALLEANLLLIELKGK